MKFHKLCIVVTILSSSVLSQKGFDREKYTKFHSFGEKRTTNIDRGSNTNNSNKRQYDKSFVSNKKEHKEKLHDFLLNGHQKMRNNTSLSEVNILRENETPAGTHIHFNQVVEGIPVHGTRSSVSFNKEGGVITANNKFKQNVVIDANTPSIDSSASISIAAEYFDLSQNYSNDNNSANLILFEKSDAQFIRAWEVSISDIKYGYWKVIVDAHNGDVISAEDFLLYSTRPSPTGMVFKPDPLTSARVDYGGDYQNNYDETNDALNNELVSVPLGTLDKHPDGDFILEGPLCWVIDLDGSGERIPKQSSPYFNFTRDQDEFEAVMAYYYITMMGSHIYSLGYMNAFLSDIKVDPRSDYPGAYYHSGENFILLGGSKDDEDVTDLGEDADVIIHEYGHAIQKSQGFVNPGGRYDGPRFITVCEGLADYWASSYSRSVTSYKSDSLFKWCNLDGLDRSCNVDRIYVKTAGAYPHAFIRWAYKNGELLSTALMQIWDSLGREMTDKLVLEASAIYSGGDVGLSHFVAATIQADEALNDGRNFKIITAAFRARNLYNTVSDWVQPTGEHDCYNIYDLVRFEGSYYSSLINGNIWSPTAYPQGWKYKFPVPSK